MPEPAAFDIGITPATLRAHPDFDLEAIVVVLATPEHDLELMLSPGSAVDAIMALMTSIDQLMRGEVS
jgi:hypothetical protein